MRNVVPYVINLFNRVGDRKSRRFHNVIRQISGFIDTSIGAKKPFDPLSSYQFSLMLKSV